MTIVVMGGKYFIPVENGLKQISDKEAWELHEDGAITETEEFIYD
jgi:hypothetical protein